MFAVEAVDDDGVPRFAGTISLRDEGDERAELAYGVAPLGPRHRRHGARRAAAAGLGLRGARAADRDLVGQPRQLGLAQAGLARSASPSRPACATGCPSAASSSTPGSARCGRSDPRRPATPGTTPRASSVTGSVLRAPAERDLPRVVEYASDALTRRWLGHIPQPYGDADARAWLEDLDRAPRPGHRADLDRGRPRHRPAAGRGQRLRPVGVAAPGSWATCSTRRAAAGACAARAARLALRHAFVDTEDGGLGLAQGPGPGRGGQPGLPRGARRPRLRAAGTGAAWPPGWRATPWPTPPVYDVTPAEVVKTSV